MSSFAQVVEGAAAPAVRVVPTRDAREPRKDGVVTFKRPASVGRRAADGRLRRQRHGRARAWTTAASPAWSRSRPTPAPCREQVRVINRPGQAGRTHGPGHAGRGRGLQRRRPVRGAGEDPGREEAPSLTHQQHHRPAGRPTGWPAGRPSVGGTLGGAPRPDPCDPDPGGGPCPVRTAQARLAAALLCATLVLVSCGTDETADDRPPERGGRAWGRARSERRTRGVADDPGGGRRPGRQARRPRGRDRAWTASRRSPGATAASAAPSRG